MGLHFGFVLKTTLIAQGWFSYCWAVLAQSPGLLPTRSQEGAQPGQLTPTDPRDIPYHVTSCSVYKAGGRRKGGMFRVMAFVCPSNCYAWWSPAFLEMAAHLPADGKQWTNPLFCFACTNGCCFTC